MATINKDRIRLIGSSIARRGMYQPIRLNASQTVVPGDLLYAATGRATQLNEKAAAGTKFLGIAERSATNSTLNDIIQMTLALPGYRYSISANSSVTTDDLFLRANGKDNATLGVLLGAVTTTETGAIFIPVAFTSDPGVFEVNRVKTQGGTSETAGRIVVPNAASGITADTSPRMITTFYSAACAMFY